MKARESAFRDPRFWYSHFRICWGQIGPAFDPRLLSEAFGANDESGIAWWHEFTRWYPEIIDESDGELQDPTTLSIRFANALSMDIEFHPGLRPFYLSAPGSKRVLLGELGPHWRLPMLRWAEASRLSRLAVGALSYSQVLLLLLPGVWPDPTDDADQVESEVAEALRDIAVRHATAERLASQWRAAVAKGIEYSWMRHRPAGWASSSEHSLRRGRSAGPLNRLLARALEKDGAK